MKSYSVRDAVPSDIEVISSIFKASGSVGWGSEDLEAAMASESQHIVIAQTKTGRDVGAGLLTIACEPSEDGGLLAEVRELAVHDDWRGIGVGAA